MANRSSIWSDEGSCWNPGFRKNPSSLLYPTYDSSASIRDSMSAVSVIFRAIEYAGMFCSMNLIKSVMTSSGVPSNSAFRSPYWRLSLILSFIVYSFLGAI